jgi:ankyrin repeat protein
MPAAAAAASTALAAAKLGLPDQLSSALAVAPAAACLRDVDGRCCLHYAAGYGHEECVDVLLAKAGVEVVKVRDSNGDLPLHLAAQQGHPMCAYNIAKVG